MSILQQFKEELRKNGEETLENIMAALNVIDDDFKKNPVVGKQELFEFGRYFMINYGEKTESERLKIDNGFGPFCLQCWWLINSMFWDKGFWNKYGKELSKKEEFELKEFKKELKNIFDEHQKLLIKKHIMLPNGLFYNFLYIEPFKNFTTEEDVELFVKNALIADHARIDVLFEDDQMVKGFAYTFDHGHWTSERGRKF